MAYTAVPDGNLDVDDPIRSADIKQLNNNVIDHEARMLALEDPNRIDVHFERDHNYTSGVACAASSTENRYYGGLFTLNTSAGQTIVEAVSQAAGSTADEHYLSFPEAASTSLGGIISANQSIYFNNRTGPVTFIARIKVSVNPASTFGMCVGFTDARTFDAALDTGFRSNNGVFLETVDATNWRFVMTRASALTAGSNFTPPTAGAWFEVKVVLMDDAGQHAECYVDDVPKSDLSGANLPVDKPIYAACAFATDNLRMGACYIDRFRLSVAGTDNAA
jgi:hypothetical protein